MWNRVDRDVIEGLPPLGSACHWHGLCRADRVGATADPDDAGDAPGVGVGLATSRCLATCKCRGPRCRWQLLFNHSGKPVDSTHASWVGTGTAAQEWLGAFGHHVDPGCHSSDNCLCRRGSHRNGCISPAPCVCGRLDGSFRMALVARRSIKAAEGKTKPDPPIKAATVRAQPNQALLTERIPADRWVCSELIERLGISSNEFWRSRGFERLRARSIPARGSPAAGTRWR